MSLESLAAVRKYAGLVYRLPGLLVLCFMLAVWPVEGVQAQAAAACNNGQKVRLADQNWESAAFSTHLFARILEDAFGCETEIVPGTPAAAEAALAQNDLQVIAEIWSGRSAIIENAIQAGQVRVVGDTLEGGAEQGWYVPEFVVKGDVARGIEPLAPELRSWQDLPRYKELFRDPEQPEKGRFLNCPTGWPWRYQRPLPRRIRRSLRF